MWRVRGRYARVASPGDVVVAEARPSVGTWLLLVLILALCAEE